MKPAITIKTIGLILFIAGFGFFLATFFISDYRLAQDILKENFAAQQENNSESTTASGGSPDAQGGGGQDGGEQDAGGKEAELPVSKYEIVSKHATGVIGKVYPSNFSFLNALEDIFQKTNEEIKTLYGINEQEVDQILAQLPDHKYELEKATSVFDGGTETDSIKTKALQDYTSWMDGNQFESKEKLKAQLNTTVANINSSVASQKGINKYDSKNIKTEITKSATIGLLKDHTLLVFLLTYLTIIVGALMYILPKLETTHPGIQNNGIFFSVLKNRGWLGIALGTFLIVFYVFLYVYPQYMTNWIVMVDPVSEWLEGKPAGRFFLYGFIYTLCILVMGIRMMINYRHSNYHLVRTASVMFFQTAFAFLIPEILLRLNQPYYDFKNIWPLDYDFFFPGSLNELINSGNLGWFMLFWGIALIIIGVPVMVYFFGKRWYCSWVCGCGGLAETLGDPYRQLSDKSLRAWQVERWMVHGVLALAVVMTIGMIYTFFTGSGSILGLNTYGLSEAYGFLIGAGFAGVIGTGFYPLMGNRVWCRFGCPLAAYLGLVQRFKSRFRITTNGGQCISCGNCSTYCEMGIDVRWYAQRGQNIVRASCVGCGVCASVCPRGVLKLENGEEEGRFGEPFLIGNDSVKVNQ